MTENLPENLPKKYTKSPKRSISDTIRLITEINPTMSGKEVIERIKTFWDLPRKQTPDQKRNREIVKSLREKRLELYGKNPSAWILYTTTQPKIEKGEENYEFKEQDLAELSSRLPKDLELFVIQGEISTTSDIDQKKGREPFIAISHSWEVYIKVRPNNSIEPPNTQLEGSNE